MAKKATGVYFPHKEVEAEVLKWLGPRIRRRMDKLGISLSMLSRMTGIGASTISDYLTRRYCPSLPKIVSLRNALKVDWDFFFEGPGILDGIATDEMVAAMWLFREEGDVAKDSSGNGHDGMLINGPKWIQVKSGKALEFDGIDDYVNCGNIAVNNEKLSVFAWIKARSGNNKWIVGKHDNGKVKRSWVMGLKYSDSSTLNIGIRETGDNRASKEYWGSIVICDDIWHHVGFTWNSGELKLYVDGIEDLDCYKNRDDDFTSFTNYDDVDVTIGTHLNYGQPRLQDCFKGIIDEVAVFNVALSQDNIRMLMNGSRFVCGKGADALY